MEPTDETLMHRYASESDRKAFEELFRRYGPRLHRYFLGKVKERALADDLVQQTFLHVHRARHDFRADGRFRPWVFAIGTNLLREHWRRKRRRPETPMGDDLRPPSVDPDTSTPTDRLVRRALAELPDHEREVVILHWFEELTFSEIADIVGASHSAVKVRAHRAYNKLRARLGED